MLLFSHFIIGFAACFIGALPLGAINLSVVSISVRKSYHKAIQFALGASLVEILEAFIAVVFGSYINQFLTEYNFIHYIIATAFLVLGLYFFIGRKAHKLNDTGEKKEEEFTKGVLVALLNPQAIPFWLFALAFLAPFSLLDLTGLSLAIFLVGVFVGKLIALVGYANLSNYLEKQLVKSCNTIDYIMGTVFISIGSFQILTHIQ